MKEDCKEVVLDASVSAAWFLDEAGSEAALALLRTEPPRFHVPAVWLAEMASVFRRGERRGRMRTSDTARALATLAEMKIDHDPAGNTFSGAERILELSRAAQINTYDAQYLELSMRLRLPLATLDQPLARAAKAAGLECMLP